MRLPHIFLAIVSISFFAANAATLPTWNYRHGGDDWTSDKCVGQSQSPINVPLFASMQRVHAGAEMQLSMGLLPSTGNNVAFTNDGNALRMSWPVISLAPTWTVMLPAEATTLSETMRTDGTKTNNRAIPVLLDHLEFHTPSEHSFGGRFYPVEVQITGTVDRSRLSLCGTNPSDNACTIIVSIFMDYGEYAQGMDNTFLNAVLDHVPLSASVANTFLPANININMTSLLPETDSYVSYVGSKTSPPCAEGVVWALMTDTIHVSKHQVDILRSAISAADCDVNGANCVGKLTNGVNNREIQTSLTDRTYRVFIDTKLAITQFTPYAAQELGAFTDGLLSYTQPVPSPVDAKAKGIGFGLNDDDIVLGMLFFVIGVVISFPIFVFVRKVGCFNKKDEWYIKRAKKAPVEEDQA